LQIPANLVDQLAANAHRIGIIFGQVFSQTGNAGVHFRSTEFLVVTLFTGRGF
jgi:hypothetical protein